MGNPKLRGGDHYPRDPGAAIANPANGILTRVQGDCWASGGGDSVFVSTRTRNLHGRAIDIAGTRGALAALLRSQAPPRKHS